MKICLQHKILYLSLPRRMGWSRGGALVPQYSVVVIKLLLIHSSLDFLEFIPSLKREGGSLEWRSSNCSPLDVNPPRVS